MEIWHETFELCLRLTWGVRRYLAKMRYKLKSVIRIKQLKYHFA